MLDFSNFKIWALLNYSNQYNTSQLTLLIDIDTKMILYMGKLTRSYLRLSSLGNATYSWMSGKFTDFQISILCHHIVSKKFSFEFHI